MLLIKIMGKASNLGNHTYIQTKKNYYEIMCNVQDLTRQMDTCLLLESTYSILLKCYSNREPPLYRNTTLQKQHSTETTLYRNNTLHKHHSTETTLYRNITLQKLHSTETTLYRNNTLHKHHSTEITLYRNITLQKHHST